MTKINNNQNQNLNINFRGSEKMSSLPEPKFLVEEITELRDTIRCRCEREMPEYGDFAPIVESFDNKDKSIHAGNIQLKCAKAPNNIENHHKKRYVQVILHDPNNVNYAESILVTGDKYDVMAEISRDKFIENLKLKITELSDILKNKDENNKIY